MKKKNTAKPKQALARSQASSGQRSPRSKPASANTEEALRQSEQRFRAVTDHFPAILVLYDAERRAQYLNAATVEHVKRFLGRSPEEVLGKRDEEIWPVEDTQGYVPALKRVYETGEPQTIAWTSPERYGSREVVVKYVPLFQKHGKVTEVLGVYFDTTETKELHLSRQRLDFIIEAVGVGLWWNKWPLDKLQWNRQNKEHFQLPAEAEIDPQTFFKLIHPDDMDPRRLALEKAIREHDLYDFTYRTLAPDGSGKLKWVRAMGRASYNSQGRPVSISGITLDVTPQKEMEEALRQSEEQSRQLNQDLEKRVVERTAILQQTVAELEAFTYTIGHDLRAPLRAQLGYATLLLENYGDVLGETGRSYTQSIATAAHRLDLLLRDLLAHARLSREEVELVPVDLSSVVKEVLTALAVDIASHQADISIQQPLLPVMGHPRLLNQILSNFLSNALKFVQPGVPPKIQMGTEKGADFVRVWVQDNGVGIAPEYQEQIFGIFQRLHSEEEYPGTGIGLAIAKKAAERIGGRVGVESQPGVGSRFWVQLRAEGE